MEKVLLILSMFPKIIEAIKSLEDFLPIPDAGKAKMDLIITTIQDAYPSVASIIPLVEKLISGVVTLANTFGVFNKSAK